MATTLLSPFYATMPGEALETISSGFQVLAPKSQLKVLYPELVSSDQDLGLSSKSWYHTVSFSSIFLISVFLIAVSLKFPSQTGPVLKEACALNGSHRGVRTTSIWIVQHGASCYTTMAMQNTLLLDSQKIRSSHPLKLPSCLLKGRPQSSVIWSYMTHHRLQSSAPLINHLLSVIRNHAN